MNFVIMYLLTTLAAVKLIVRLFHRNSLTVISRWKEMKVLKCGYFMPQNYQKKGSFSTFRTYDTLTMGKPVKDQPLSVHIKAPVEEQF